MDLMQYGVTDTEVEFLAKKEADGDLVSEISAEFTGDADQITVTPASGKDFVLVEARLIPVVDTIHMNSSSNNVATTNRRCDVELTFDSTVKDILTHDHESRNGYVPGSGTAHMAAGSAGVVGNYSTLMKGIRMTGDGAKTVKLTSTNTSGTYRVALLGYYEVS